LTQFSSAFEVAIESDDDSLFIVLSNGRSDVKVAVNCAHDSVATLLVDNTFDCFSVMSDSFLSTKDVWLFQNVVVKRSHGKLFLHVD
jgi:hypothetical protein